MGKSNAVICNNCKWVHFEVSLEYVLDWQNDWIDFWLKCDEETRAAYDCESRPPSYKETYLNCHGCGGSHKNFRKALKKEVPYGSTIGPILTRKAF